MNKPTTMMKTAGITREWHLIDATDATLGRLATRIAKLLTGKSKVDYTPHMDMGDYVVVTNAKNVKLTGNKLLAKTYKRHSGHPGGFREESAGRLMDRDPRKVIEHAVNGMLAKNKLQDPRMSRLKVYVHADHPHANHFEKKEQS